MFGRIVKRRDKLALVFFIVLIVLPLSPFFWGMLRFLAWYIRRIPERKLPLTNFLVTYSDRFYTWLGDYLASWFKWTFIFLVFILFLVTAGLAILARVGGDEPFTGIMQFFSAPLSIGGLKFIVFFFISFAGAFYWTHSSNWSALYWQAEPAAKVLVGNAEYASLSDAEKNLIKQHVVAAEVGINKGSWIVTAGKLQTINPPSGPLAKFGGPGFIIIQTGHAVVVERRGKERRILGEGFHQLESFERPQMIIPLFTQTARLKVENLITKDGVVIDEFDAFVFHRIDQGAKTHDPGSKYPFDDEVIWKRIWDPKGGDPSDSVRAIAGTAARQVVAQHTVEELFVDHATARRTLRDELITQANLITTPFVGYTVIAAAIDNIVLSETTKEKLWQTWAAQRDRDILEKASAVEAKVLDILEKARNLVREDLLKKISDALLATRGVRFTDDVVKRMLEVVEEVSKQTLTEDVTAKYQLELLKGLIKSEAEKHIYIGAPPLVGMERK